jgi:heat shock protein HslJ/phosphoglycolate phosphatase-like HAD superfamily hydrolase
MRSSCCGLLVAILLANCAAGEEPLPSWNDTAPKQAILAFVQRVTTVGSADFVPPPERVAVFDNDGTLWPEAPLPFQAIFAFDQVKRRAKEDPQLAADPAVQAVIAGDLASLMDGNTHAGLLRILGLTHAGLTTEQFASEVKHWLQTARHPRFDKPYTDLAYLPMLELLDYLRGHGFKTFIVSGGGADFMRVWTEGVYGIPPENVVGSTGQTRFELRDGQPVLLKTLDHLFVDDKEGKPVAIHQFIGRRPIACFGNSDGDQAMLEYTTIGNPRPSFGLLVHHTDSQREFAYDANPPASGKLTTALQAAPQRGWTVVDMESDWNRVWHDPAEKSPGAPQGTERQPATLEGKWLAEDIEGRGVIDRAQSTLEIGEEGEATGNTAVNRFRGSFDRKGQQIQFGRLATTRRAGPPALMDQERRYLSGARDTRG